MEVTNKTGRRKTAVARVYLTAGSGNIVVNGKDYKTYFPTPMLQYVANQAFEVTGTLNQFDVKANLDGGGIRGVTRVWLKERNRVVPKLVNVSSSASVSIFLAAAPGSLPMSETWGCVAGFAAGSLAVLEGRNSRLESKLPGSVWLPGDCFRERKQKNQICPE